MDTNMKLVDAILSSANDAQGSNGTKSLTCEKAFRLAEEYEAHLAEIGRICNQHNIKICKCQLGCFK